MNKKCGVGDQCRNRISPDLRLVNPSGAEELCANDVTAQNKEELQMNVSTICDSGGRFQLNVQRFPEENRRRQIQYQKTKLCKSTDRRRRRRD
ncbi:hypothetical protein CEXT_396381 [Caerostris extrusa]|uniref:Uncharacterized protein n=1 Tax=Caerostris extrusa TaxID=172846 RepID=A0AAV4Y2P5_CAEEX|nr:hypothetical protein CEXT_396381 [Caerostris extrusa]